MQKIKALFFAAAFLCAAAFAQDERNAQSSVIKIQKSKVPQINSLNVRDKDYMLKQFDDEVEQNKQFFISGKPVLLRPGRHPAADWQPAFASATTVFAL